MRPRPQFLKIRWDANTPEQGEVTLEAMLCLPHRWQIALTHASARGTEALASWVKPATSARGGIPDQVELGLPVRRSHPGSPDG